MRCTMRTAVLGALVLLGCGSSMKVQSEFDAGADFGGYRTWAWAPEPELTGDARIDNKDTLGRLRSVIEREMAARGFRRGEEPDFLVTYHAALSNSANVQSVNDASGGGTTVQNPERWMSETGTYDWQEGSLILDFLDAGTKALTWRGSAETKINLSALEEEREAKVAEVVRKILERFPPETPAAKEAAR